METIDEKYNKEFTLEELSKLQDAIGYSVALSGNHELYNKIQYKMRLCVILHDCERKPK